MSGKLQAQAAKAEAHLHSLPQNSLGPAASVLTDELRPDIALEVALAACRAALRHLSSPGSLDAVNRAIAELNQAARVEGNPNP